MNQLLVIDDDAELCELLREYLAGEGFEVETASSGTEGLRMTLEREHSLVVLDVMLPDLNGLEVLRRIRAVTPTPILMLTARGDEVDRIVGLEIGADDYLSKPFNARELTARIRAILRRAKPERDLTSRSSGRSSGAQTLKVGDVELDTGTRSVHCGEKLIELTSVEFDLLVVLLRGAGRVISREELVRSVLDREFTPLDRSIDMHVSNLRKKLGPGRSETPRIRTVRNAGYLFTSG